MDHTELCYKASQYLKKEGITPFHRCQYVFCELERYGESPDAIGISGVGIQLIEVKISRSDFLLDRKKPWRKRPEIGLGNYRSYLCPEGLINESDLPENWGLLWIDSNNIITKIVTPKKQESNHNAEIHLLMNIMRREGIKPKIYFYKKHNKNKKTL